MPIRSSSLPRSVARAVRPERECLLAASLGLSLSVEPSTQQGPGVYHRRRQTRVRMLGRPSRQHVAGRWQCRSVSSWRGQRCLKARLSCWPGSSSASSGIVCCPGVGDGCKPGRSRCAGASTALPSTTAQPGDAPQCARLPTAGTTSATRPDGWKSHVRAADTPGRSRSPQFYAPEIADQGPEPTDSR
jgi:hypothetical protein